VIWRVCGSFVICFANGVFSEYRAAMALFGSRHYREPLRLRPLPTRQRSRSAIWALRFAVLAPILLAVSAIAHHSDAIETSAFVVLLAFVVAIAMIGVFFISVSLHSLWTRGRKGGRNVIGAIFLTIVTLGPFIAGGIAGVVFPLQNDVSTDLVDPPLFREEASLTGANPLPIVAGFLKDGYPELTGRRYKASPEAIEQTILRVAERFGWKAVTRRGRIGADDLLDFEFSYRVPILHFPGSVILRITDEGDTSFVDVRSRVDYVPHDLGWNAWLIERYLTVLDFELIGIVAG
jgi:MFS family permease